MRARVFVFCAALLVFLVTGIRAAKDPSSAPRETPETPGTPAIGIASPALAGGGFLRRDWTLPPSIGARSILIADLENGEEILRVRADAEWPIASLTKLMTAALVLERFDLNDEITLAQSDFDLGKNGMAGTLAPGETYRVRELLPLMLVPSSNEVAEAFARAYGRESFIAAMNAKAKEWELARTHFADPSGLDGGNRSTAEDLLRFSEHIHERYPEIFAMTRLARVTVNDVLGAQKTVESTHKFAGQADFLGGKTGTTRLAGENLISIFSYGHPAIIIVLGDENRFGNTERLFQWFTHDFRPGD